MALCAVVVSLGRAILSQFACVIMLIRYEDQFSPKQCPTAPLCELCFVDSEDCAIAVWYCDECAMPMCTKCFLDTHKAGRRKHHWTQVIDIPAIVAGLHLCCHCQVRGLGGCCRLWV